MPKSPSSSRKESESLFLPTPSQRRKLTTQEAKRLAKLHPRTKNIDTINSDWFRAEAMLDEKILAQNLTPTQAHGALMTKFFASIEGRDFTDDEVAVSFLKFFKWNTQFLSKATAAVNKSPAMLDFRNIAVVADQSTEFSLGEMTKRSSLLADTTLLSHDTDRTVDIDFLTEPVGGTPGAGHDYVYTYQATCASTSELGRWLLDCRGLLLAGDIIYVPKILSELIVYDVYGTHGPQVEQYYLHEAFSSSRKFVQGGRLRAHYPQVVRAITEVELPFIDVDLRHFAEISVDEHRSMEVFRHYLRDQFFALTENEGSEHYDRNLEKIGNKINTDVERLTADFELLGKKTAIQAVGGAIGTVVATLVAINMPALGNLSGLSGLLTGGGGLAYALKIATEHMEERARLKNDPLYYCWLLENKK